MFGTKGAPKRGMGPDTWPPTHTGSSDEYETDDFDQSEVESSDEEGGNDAVASSGARKRWSRSSGKRKSGSSNKQSSSGRSGGSAVDLLDSDNDSSAGLPVQRTSRKSSAKKKAESSDDDYEADDGAVSSGKGKGRKALGRINNNHGNDTEDDSDSDDSDDVFMPHSSNSKRKKAKSNTSDSDSSDSSDSDMSFDLGKNRRKELAAKRRKLQGKKYGGGSSSEEEGSESDSEREGEKKKPAAKGRAAAKGKKSYADSDSDSSDSCEFVGTQGRRNPKWGAASPAKKPAAKKPDTKRSPPRKSASKRSSVDESLVASDDEDLPPIPEIRFSPRKEKPAATSKAPPEKEAHHDPSVRAASNKALEEAKKMREQLRAAQDYEAKEAEVQETDLNLPAMRAKPVEAIDVDLDSDGGGKVAAMPSYTGPTIRLTLRYPHPATKKDSKTNIKIKTDQPLQHLADEFTARDGSLEIAVAKFDGLALNMSKTPAFYDMEDEDLIDAVVKQRAGRVSNVRPLTRSPQAKQRDLGKPVKVKFRVNGKANEVDTLSVPSKGTFQSAMAQFAQKRNVSLATCKFIFDGEVLQPTMTPEGLDLEGGEIIDVKIPDGGAQQPPPSGTFGSMLSWAGRGAAARPVAPPAMISFQTNRNQNKGTRHKTWKLSNTDSFATLKAEYMKYRKSGCSRVTFYFRNAAISDVEIRSLRDLGIGDGHMLYAMENGAAYRPV
ncbi:hypothetical protein ACHAXT_008913 [Thalassiosira profunda]